MDTSAHIEFDWQRPNSEEVTQHSSPWFLTMQAYYLMNLFS